MLYTRLNVSYIGGINLPKQFNLALIEEYVYYILIFIGVVISYFIVRPFITWLVTLQLINLLSYIIGSLVFLVLLVLAMVSVEELNHLLVNFIKIALQCLAVFGIVLTFFLGLGRIIKKT